MEGICMATILEEISCADRRLEPLAHSVRESAELHRLVLSAFKFSLTLALIIVEEILNYRAENMDDKLDRPFCSRPLESKGKIVRVMETLIGTLRWKRRIRRCEHGCPVNHAAPFDGELGIAPTRKTSSELKYLGCLLAVFVPFNIAETLLADIFGIGASRGAIWNWVQEAGGKAMAKLQNELERFERGEEPEEEKAVALTENLPMVAGADGVMVPFRPDGGNPEGKTVWLEVKVGIVARIGERINRKGEKVSVVVRKRVAALLGKIDEFKRFLWLLSVKEGIRRSETVAWLCDGGKGFWRMFREKFSECAIGILDFYHAVQNVWKGAKSWLDGRTKKAGRWYEDARKRIRGDGVSGVIKEIRGVLANGGLTNESEKALEKLANYLANHVDHMKYEDYKNLGLPIGSGIVESACKWLIQQRFKGVGMRWSVNGFVSLCSLRVAWVNDSFRELFFDRAPPN